MFDSETRWFIRCDTCPGEPPAWIALPSTYHVLGDPSTQSAIGQARAAGWEIRDDLHRCPHCVRKGRTEMAS